MGDPKRITNKYNTPMHPWEKDRLAQEKPLMQKYGLVNKTELWKAASKLKKFKDIAKSLIASRTAQAEKERKQLFDKLKAYNLIQTETLDEILELNIEKVLDRRLQTIVHKKGLARTIKQARQMITHKHILIKGKRITSPSHLVRVSEEASIEFYGPSAFAKADHPERVAPETVPKKKEVVHQAKVEAVEGEN